MKRIISVTLLLIMLLAFTACNGTETPTQIPSQTATENSEQTLVATETPTLEITQETTTAPVVTATATPTIEITQAPTLTVTPTLEITKKPTATPTIKITPEPTESHQLKEIIIDTSDEYFGWVHEEGAGNSAHLAEAVRRIEAYKSLETAYPSPCDASSWPHYPSKEQKRTVRETVTEHLKNILWDLDVFVYRIVVGGQILADKWDENGNWVPAHVEPHICVIIQLEAGNQQEEATMFLK